MMTMIMVMTAMMMATTTTTMIMMMMMQVVVLARIIPDEEQAKSSAIGIKLLVDILDQSTCDDVTSMAAAYIACLAHTRAGQSALLVTHSALMVWSVSGCGQTQDVVNLRVWSVLGCGQSRGVVSQSSCNTHCSHGVVSLKV